MPLFDSTSRVQFLKGKWQGGERERKTGDREPLLCSLTHSSSSLSFQVLVVSPDLLGETDELSQSLLNITSRLDADEESKHSAGGCVCVCVYVCVYTYVCVLCMCVLVCVCVMKVL